MKLPFIYFFVYSVLKFNYSNNSAFTLNSTLKVSNQTERQFRINFILHFDVKVHENLFHELILKNKELAGLFLIISMKRIKVVKEIAIILVFLFSYAFLDAGIVCVCVLLLLQ